MLSGLLRILISVVVDLKALQPTALTLASKVQALALRVKALALRF